MATILTKAGVFINWLAAFTLVLAYLCTIIPPDRLWFLAFFGLAYPYLLLFNILFIFFWFYVSPKHFWISTLFVGIGYMHIVDVIQLKGKTTDSKETIKIFSFNSHGFISNEKDVKKREPIANIYKFIREQKADIICLQETSIRPKGERSITNIIKQISNGKTKLKLITPKKVRNYAILTHYDIKDQGEIHFERTTNMVMWADIKSDKGMVRVYNCHLQSNRIRPHEYSIIKNPKINIEDQTVKEVRELGSKLKCAFKNRAAQVREIKDHMASSPYPVIVCGDFNDTPVSYTYWQMAKDLKDTFVESGRGISNTYRGKLPSFRIDYILADKKFDAFNYRRFRVDYSDHYPISCELVLNPSK